MHLREATNVTVELARQNILEHPDTPELEQERERQIEAVDRLEAFLDEFMATPNDALPDNLT